MGWKRRLGKPDRWEEEENRHNQDEDMEKEAEVARRENKRSNMGWGSTDGFDGILERGEGR